MDLISLITYLDDHTVKLVAVSKTKPPDQIMKVYQKGVRDFGENRVQEMVEKEEVLPKDIKWHLIGQLQRNKVKYIVDFVHMIHSVDSLKLLKEINKRSCKINRVTNVLIQIKIAREDSKSGIDFDQLLTEVDAWKEYEYISIRGVMGIGTLTDDEEVTRSEFEKLKDCFDILKQRHFSKTEYFSEISMGMSGDYKLAIDCGSTMVRIGSMIFGARS